MIDVGKYTLILWERRVPFTPVFHPVLGVKVYSFSAGSDQRNLCETHSQLGKLASSCIALMIGKGGLM